MRFPSRVLISRARMISGGEGNAPCHERPLFEIEQSYDNYQIYEVRTSDSIGRVAADEEPD
jgi:hypothetical protein